MKDEAGNEADAEPPEQTPAPSKANKPVESSASKNKRYELEHRRKAKADLDTAKAKAATQNTDPPKAKSPGRAAKQQEPPKVKSPGKGKQPRKKDKPKGKSPGRSTKGAKTPKAREKPGDDAMDREVAQTSKKAPAKDTETGDAASSHTVATKNKKTKAPQHMDDENFDLDLNTGKFVKRKRKPVTVAPDDDDDIEMEEIDDEDKDKDYDPNKDDDQGDDEDEDEQNDEEDNADDDDDDFPIPPLRSRKTAAKSSDKSTSKRKKQKTSEDALGDLADFVETTFKKKPKRQNPIRKVRAEKEDDGCVNPKEAARFRQAMRDEAKELENAIRSGVNIKEAYETLITHVIEACKDMNYEIPTDIEAKDILPTIEDPTCRAWQLKLQGVKTAGEGELNLSKADNAGICVAKKKYKIKDIAKYMEEISADWTELK